MTHPSRSKAALIVVDMQNYYLSPESAYCRFFDSYEPGALSDFHERSRTVIIPNIQRLLEWSRARGLAVVYLRLCGKAADRSDLHRFFRSLDERGRLEGFPDIYPLEDDPMADVVAGLEPHPGDLVVNKTTFSPFASTDIDAQLRIRGLTTLVFTGLATSQCVETTARDASDRGFDIIHIEDAQIDYDEDTHRASLYASRGVCGGAIYSTAGFMGRDPLTQGWGRAGG